MEVQLYVYDLSRGMARSMSRQFLGIQIDAVYHTSIVLDGIEYFFGQGIQQSRPGATHHGQPMEVVPLGRTQLPLDVVLEYLESLKTTVYTTSSYDLFQHNCNNFSNDLAQFLVGKGIPDHITSLPETVLNTPFGQMLRPQLDASMRSITQAPVPPQAMSAAPKPQQAASVMPSSGLSKPKTSKEHGEVYLVTDISHLDSLLSEARSGCATIFFTSSTCAPCRLAYPTFDSLAAQNPKAIFIKSDMNAAPEIGSRYQVRATPTFHTYLHGKLQEEWSGADPGRLRSTVELLVQQAFPGHPHANLDTPVLTSGSLRPISFTKIPPLDKVISKMSPSTVASDPAVLSMRGFIAARASSATRLDEVSVPDIAPWASFLRSASSQLTPDTLFTAYDLARCVLLDARVAAWFAAEGGNGASMLTIKGLLSHVAGLASEGTCPYSLRLVILQLSCVLLASPSPLMSRVCLTDRELAHLLAQLSASSLLAEPDKPACLTAAASLAFNLAAANYRIRREETREVLEDGVQVELAAALLECLGMDNAGQKEGIHQALFAFGYLLHFADTTDEVADLCRAMEARTTVEHVECEGLVERCRQDVLRIIPT